MIEQRMIIMREPDEKEMKDAVIEIMKIKTKRETMRGIKIGIMIEEIIKIMREEIKTMIEGLKIMIGDIKIEIMTGEIRIGIMIGEGITVISIEIIATKKKINLVLEVVTEIIKEKNKIII